MVILIPHIHGECTRIHEDCRFAEIFLSVRLQSNFFTAVSHGKTKSETNNACRAGSEQPSELFRHFPVKNKTILLSFKKSNQFSRRKSLILCLCILASDLLCCCLKPIPSRVLFPEGPQVLARQSSCTIRYRELSLRPPFACTGLSQAQLPGRDSRWDDENSLWRAEGKIISCKPCCGIFLHTSKVFDCE